MADDAVTAWLASSKPAVIDGLFLRPRPSAFLGGAALCVQRGQADVLFSNAADNSGWVIKKFRPGKTPDNSYLDAVARLLPHRAGFRCGTARSVLHGRDLKKQSGSYYSTELRDWFNGTVLMPEIAGNDWAAVADDIRSGALTPTSGQRVALCVSLAELVEAAESSGVAHRDIASGNVFVDPVTGQTELIDFDAVFHPLLSMPKNTTCGTDGYMAPFLWRKGCWDVVQTWCPIADRFALAVLNTEFLATRKGSPQGNDGGLFMQEELCQRKGNHLDHAVDALRSEYPEALPLFVAAINSRSFGDCPTPSDWLNLYSGCSRAAQHRPGRGIPSLDDLPAVQICLPQIRPPVPVALPSDPWMKKAI